MVDSPNPSLLGQTPGLLGSTADLDRNKLLAAIQQALLTIAGTQLTNGSWVPTDLSGAGLAINPVYAKYIKIGTFFYATVRIAYPTNSSGANLSFSLPPGISIVTGGPGAVTGNTGVNMVSLGGGGQCGLFNSTTVAAITNAGLSNANFYTTIMGTLS